MIATRFARNGAARTPADLRLSMTKVDCRTPDRKVAKDLSLIELKRADVDQLAVYCPSGRGFRTSIPNTLASASYRSAIS